MKSTYTTSWYGENFCIKSCHLKVGNLVLQEIIFLTNNLDKLRAPGKCTVIKDFKPWAAFILSEEVRAAAKKTLVSSLKAFIGEENILRGSQ